MDDHYYIFSHRIKRRSPGVARFPATEEERRIEEAKRKYVEEHGNVEWLERHIQYILEHPWQNIGATGYF